MTRSTGLREQRKQTTRRALVETALRLFAERGYGAVTVDDVCAEVAVSPRTFFRYFTTKEHVLAEPIEAALDAVRDGLRNQPTSGYVWPQLRVAVLSAIELIEERRADFLRTARIVREAPEAVSSNARAFMEWELAVRSEVAHRLDTPAADLRPRLLLGLAMLAFRGALEVWSEAGGDEDLTLVAERSLDAVATGAVAIETG